jgi:sugar transferase (PEP-CTERM/EpsH1 system associated)
MWAILAGVPVTVRHFYSSKLQEQIDDMLTRIPVDAVFCSSSPMAEYVFASRHSAGVLARARKYMDLIDVDSYKWGQYARAAGPLNAWVYRYESQALGAYEKRIAREFDHMFVVSEQERKLFPGDVIPPNLYAMSNGVDLEYFAPRPRCRENDTPTLVFTGVMDYLPNVDGVCWFVAAILPRVRAEFPNVRFVIVGSRPSSTVRKLAELDRVTVTGFVEDVRDYIATADLCVVPLRIARGVQNKVLEAMSMARPVVLTAQAHEGLRATDGSDLVVANSESAFASAIVGLLREPERARIIGENARACVQSNYDWEGNLQCLRALGL